MTLEQWVPAARDQMIVDTKNNVGYLVHESGESLSFPVATGQKRTVRYIGRVYNAKTPDRQWIAKTQEVKGDHVTFGPRGIFLRLFMDGGDTETAYGIHGHRDSAVMLAGDDRYRSMGCILVSEEMLTVILQELELSGGFFPVTTTNGIEQLAQLAT